MVVHFNFISPTVLLRTIFTKFVFLIKISNFDLFRSFMMKITIILAFCALAAYVTVGDGAEMTCKEFTGVLMKKQLGGISACAKSMKFKNPKEKAAKMNCILKCVLIKEKMLEGNGQMVNEEKWQEFLTGLVPANLMDLAGPRLTKCKAIAVEPFDNDDEFCKSYDPLIKCMLDVVGSLCKGQPA